MVRFPQSAGLPWHADRPALELYGTFASDGRLPEAVRGAARNAASAVAATVLAHRESGGFEPFDGADYSNAAGPTVHFPVSAQTSRPVGAANQRDGQRVLRRASAPIALTNVIA